MRIISQCSVDLGSYKTICEPKEAKEVIRKEVAIKFAEELLKQESLFSEIDISSKSYPSTLFKMEAIIFNVSTASRIFALLNKQHLSSEVIKKLKEIFIEKI